MNKSARYAAKLLVELVELVEDADNTLLQAVKAHEAKHGPGLPTSEAPAWQAARALLVAINKARHELGGDA